MLAFLNALGNVLAMILQDAIPHDVAAAHRLPGVAPLNAADWLHIDEAYGPQMAERRRLMLERAECVHAMPRQSLDAAREVLELVLRHLGQRDDFDISESGVRGPDNHLTTVDFDAPLLTLGSIIQEDICLIQKPKDSAEHILGAALLCFPASWRLVEKIGRPLSAIHKPVPEYAPVANRVQRLFDGVQYNRPLWRCNALWYDDPALYQPRSAQRPEALARRSSGRFLRSERQCILRLPRTRAVVFSIHTYVVKAHHN